MIRSVSAGGLRRRVSIETYTTSTDSIGAPTKVAATLATLWAKIEPLYGFEVKESARVVSDVTHRVTIRYRADVTAKMRVVYGSRKFDISAVRHDEESRRFTYLDCKEHA